MIEIDRLSVILGVYVYGVMFLAGIAMLCTVIVLSAHHAHCRLRPVPRVLRSIVHEVIGRMLRMNGDEAKVAQQSLALHSDTSGTDAKTSSSRADDRSNSTTTSDAVWSGGTDRQQSIIRDEWIHTARVIDRFFFIVFIVVVVATTAPLLIAVAVNGPRKVEPIQ